MGEQVVSDDAARGKVIPNTRRPTEVNSSRLATKNAATNMMIRILANSPGWIDSAPSRSHSLAPLTSDTLGGRSPGSTSSPSPTRPKVYA